MTDMRELFKSASGDLPPAPFTVDEITARGRRLRRRRTALRVAGSAAAVAVVGAVIPHLLGGATPQRLAPAAVPSAPAPAVPPFALTVQSFTVGPDFAVEASTEVTPGYESARVVRPHATDIGVPGGIKQQSGVLTVYRAGVFDPSRYATGATTTVAGRPARTQVFAQVIQIPDPQNPDRTVAHTMRLASIAWQYAADAWATVTATNDGKYYGMTAAEVKTVAARFVPAFGGSVATAPYALGALPTGWQLASAGGDDVTVLNSGSGAISHVVLARADVGLAQLTGRVDLTAGILLSVQKNDSEGPYRHPFTHPACQERADGQGAFCDRAIGTSGYYVEVVDGSRTLTGAQVDAIARGLRFADPADRATWVPVAS